MMEESRAAGTVAVPLAGVQGRLALAFQELLTVTVRVRSGRDVPSDIDAFRAQVRELLVQADEEARGFGYPAEFVKLSVYVTIAFLDEVVLRTRGPLASAWAGRPMQEEIFEDVVAGERFFQHLDDLLARRDSPFVADILEVLLLCLQLGFQGRYAGSDGGELRSLIKLGNDKITSIRGSVGPLSPHGLPLEGEVLAAHRDTIVRRLGLTAVAMMVGIVLMIGAFRVFSLAPRIEPIQELVDQRPSAPSVGRAAETGTVVVLGLPAGGIVSVDGSGRGGTTLELSPGQHRIDMSATGYQSATETVSVTAGEQTPVRFPATRVVATRVVDTRPGRLRMLIDPAAYVWLDGDSLGDRSRMDTTLDASIDHFLQLQRDNFVPIDTTVTLRPGETLLLNFRLVPTRP